MSSSDPTFLSHRAAVLRAEGVTAKTLRGPAWRHPHHGVVRPANLTGDPLAIRLSDAVALMGDENCLGGWASLRAQGNSWFDGVDGAGADRDVPIHCLPRSQLRRGRGMIPLRGLVHPDEVIDLENYRVSTLARAAFDEMRMARNVREAVVILDMAVSTTSGVPHTSLDAVRRVIKSHHKMRGMVNTRRALELGSTRSASPWETHTRLLAQIDA
jgi:hypothetical protein